MTGFYWKPKEDGTYDKFKVEMMPEDKVNEIKQNKREYSFTDE
jgi:hypothetical protein